MDLRHRVWRQLSDWCHGHGLVPFRVEGLTFGVNRLDSKISLNRFAVPVMLRAFQPPIACIVFN
jgi:hypothetical protein